MSARERLLVWALTGPVGRFAAFVLDLAAALIDGMRRRGRDAEPDH